jgi:ATP-dependent phosphoenolpyruvate carboxykinase
MHNMLIRPSPEQLASFGTPDYVIYNAGVFPCNRLSKVYSFFLLLSTQHGAHLASGDDQRH